jgi:hypothetical protein
VSRNGSSQALCEVIQICPLCSTPDKRTNNRSLKRDQRLTLAGFLEPKSKPQGWPAIFNSYYGRYEHAASPPLGTIDPPSKPNRAIKCARQAHLSSAQNAAEGEERFCHFVPSGRERLRQRLQSIETRPSRVEPASTHQRMPLSARQWPDTDHSLMRARNPSEHHRGLALQRDKRQGLLMRYCYRCKRSCAQL